ncbi:phospholipase [Acinetobacter sp. ANC 4779]|uniref:phospholipase A n=1 Tax=Acinetobacter sp. ANC 4779 TaxID=2529848 RepID=UPI00103C9E6E|nr:phospholipase A [Acinetobacter sp. ANC 4779]TCB48798.1 phospholipase [Acinetobacter sp. ANC 4779]
MAFKKLERTTLQLSMIMLSSLYVTNVNAVSPESTITPASPEACSALESNADRLACYDTLFKIPEDEKTPLLSERQAANEIAPKSTEPETVKEKISHGVNSIFSVEGPKIDPNRSLLDKRWELSPDSKLGTWNIRAHQPVYLMPGFWTSNKNERPSSPNENNTVQVGNDQILKSLEAKFQLSLKTKAVENLFGDNGDIWVGYTQSSRWQVYNAEESRPFRESNYEPEASLIFRTNYEILGLNARLLGLTFNHQSNGRADPLSRSWNRVMLNLGFERENFAVMVRPWYRIEEDAKDDNNPDIKNYMGRGDLTAFYRKNEHEFSLMLRHSLKGGDDSHGAAQFDWAFPIKGKLRGYFQLFDGYGESLIDYNHRATYVGLGVSLMNWY